MHIFNHQTHHRGQLTTLLMQMGIDPGETPYQAALRELHEETGVTSVTLLAQAPGI